MPSSPPPFIPDVVTHLRVRQHGSDILSSADDTLNNVLKDKAAMPRPHGGRETQSKKDTKAENVDQFHWVRPTTAELFSNKRVVLFGLPGAFSPVCTDKQLPGYERAHDEIIASGIDEVWCTAVNDAFVMFNWAKQLGIQKVKLLPDGNADFARGVGMLVRQTTKGFGVRSWRYVAVVNHNNIEFLSAEPGKMDDAPRDPYVCSRPEDVMAYLRFSKKKPSSSSSSKNSKKK